MLAGRMIGANRMRCAFGISFPLELGVLQLNWCVSIWALFGLPKCGERQMSWEIVFINQSICTNVRVNLSVILAFDFAIFSRIRQHRSVDPISSHNRYALDVFMSSEHICLDKLLLSAYGRVEFEPVNEGMSTLRERSVFKFNFMCVHASTEEEDGRTKDQFDK